MSAFEACDDGTVRKELGSGDMYDERSQSQNTRKTNMTLKRNMQAALLCIGLLACLLGCEQVRRGGSPGDKWYIAPRNVSVTIVDAEPGYAKEVGGQTVVLQPYSVVEAEDGKRYRVSGKVGQVGDTFTMDVSLMKEIGG